MTEGAISGFSGGSFGGDTSKLEDGSVLECKICWWQYDPAEGDEYWQIPVGTPFAKLPDHWSCPNCDGRRQDFIVVSG